MGYCMTSPAQMMQALEFPAVTNARASNDGGRPYTNQGPANMLLWALDLRPFKDNAQTSLPNDVAGSVMAMSPVGIGDKLGSSDFETIKRSCRSDGVILHPSRPGFPLNAYYHPSATSGAETWITHSAVPGLTCYTAMTGEWAQSETWLITADDLHPPAEDSTALRWWAWNAAGDHRPAAACAVGQASKDCLSAMPAQGYSVAGGGAKGQFRLYQACPQVSGWVLLGERSKYMPVSPQRFTSVDMRADGIHVELAGAPAEVVELTYATPDGVIAATNITIGNSGVATADLSGGRSFI